MNRKIKFRGWIPEDKKMFYQDDQYLGSFIRRLVGFITGFKEHESYLSGKLEDYLMQYTGLKDKNGVEIYEGDVVDGYKGKHVIEWGEIVGYGFGFVWRPLEGNTESVTGFIDEYEVIGNIYENPDLLN